LLVVLLVVRLRLHAFLALFIASPFLSHANDAGHWNVKEYFGPSLLETFKTWSAMSCLVSAMGLGGVHLLAALGQA
jgi:GntP family gluconate:H+ symporter